MIKITGLTNAEVTQRVQEGKVNTLPAPESKSNFKIVFDHVFTLFNLYTFTIALVLIYVKAYTSLFFMGILISNAFMFSTQEIRSKNIINKLSILVTPKTKVIRDSKEIEIHPERLVLDDIIKLESGDQIPTDSIIISGFIEANESLLTGEIDPIDKKEGDLILSGSFVVSGVCYARVKHIKLDNYAVKITLSAKKHRVIASELIKTFKTVTKFTSLFIIPLGTSLMYQGLVMRKQPLADVVVNTSTALLGMLPQGLILLTTVSLMAAVIRLGTKKTLIQDMYAIETLSQVDVLCLDKTGTLTYGILNVIDTLKLDPLFDEYIESFLFHTLDSNTTTQALKEYYQPFNKYTPSANIPFSSLRKWSAMTFDDITVMVGAPEILYPDYIHENNGWEEHQTNGSRILAMAATHQSIDKNTKLSSIKIQPLGLVALKDTIRTDAKESLSFFYENEIDIKIISGDNPDTVRIIAHDAGVKDTHKYIDASTLTDYESYENAILNHNIIGRATPDQKVDFIEILQKHKNKVAMIGDGVNDVLALKQSNVSIAMGEGSDAALSISQVIVMDRKLSTLVDVFKEGRQVINSITLSASMYYLRTMMTVFLAITAVIMNIPFPFVPFQVTITNMFVDGFPSFMILWEKNYHKPKESIIRHVLRFALPNALATIIVWVGLNLFSITPNTPTIIYFITAFISIQLIYRLYSPMNWYRSITLLIDGVGFVITSYIFFNWLQLQNLSPTDVNIMIITALISLVVIKVIAIFTTYYLDSHKEFAA